MTNIPVLDAPQSRPQPRRGEGKQADSEAADKAARHRAAQARYANSEKGRAKRRAWHAQDVRSGRKAARQRRYYANLSERQYAWMLFRNNTWRRRIADERDTARLLAFGRDSDDWLELDLRPPQL